MNENRGLIQVAPGSILGPTWRRRLPRRAPREAKMGKMGQDGTKSNKSSQGDVRSKMKPSKEPVAPRKAPDAKVGDAICSTFIFCRPPKMYLQEIMLDHDLEIE